VTLILNTSRGQPQTCNSPHFTRNINSHDDCYGHSHERNAYSISSNTSSLPLGKSVITKPNHGAWFKILVPLAASRLRTYNMCIRHKILYSCGCIRDAGNTSCESHRANEACDAKTKFHRLPHMCRRCRAQDGAFARSGDGDRTPRPRDFDRGPLWGDSW